MKDFGCLLNVYNTTKNWLVSHILTPHCVCCGRFASNSSLCNTCLEQCRQVASTPPIPDGLSSISCGPTLNEPLRKLIHALKYRGMRQAARDLVALVPEASVRSFPKDAILVPIPLHVAKQRERGYNQALLLAEHWSTRLNIPVERSILERFLFTSTQTKLDAEQRKANLDRAFRANSKHVSGKVIILVDDVLTTGATLTACAAVLLEAGASKVHGICIAWAGEA